MPNNATRLVRGFKSSAERIGVSVSTLKRLIKAGRFDPPIKVSPGRVGFPDDQIDRYLENCIAERDARKVAA